MRLLPLLIIPKLLSMDLSALLLTLLRPLLWLNSVLEVLTVVRAVVLLRMKSAIL